MSPQGGHRDSTVQVPSSEASDALAYRRLLARLAARAKGLGSLDPEGAGQEALKRSLENLPAREAIQYYFGQEQPASSHPSEWALDHLIAWLHGVLYFVVKEEHHQAAVRREIPAEEDGRMDPPDPAPDQLDLLIKRELRAIVVDSFPKLDREYQTVLSMRASGLKYGEIAERLGVSENTVATWVSRGIRSLSQYVRRRTVRLISLPGGAAR